MVRRIEQFDSLDTDHIIIEAGHNESHDVAVSHFVSLLDSCLARDCYTQHHRQLLSSWRHKVNTEL